MGVGSLPKHVNTLVMCRLFPRVTALSGLMVFGLVALWPYIMCSTSMGGTILELGTWTREMEMVVIHCIDTPVSVSLGNHNMLAFSV